MSGDAGRIGESKITHVISMNQYWTEEDTLYKVKALDHLAQYEVSVPGVVEMISCEPYALNPPAPDCYKTEKN